MAYLIGQALLSTRLRNTLFRLSLRLPGNFEFPNQPFHPARFDLILSMRQGLRDPVSMTGGAPPCSCRARRAATRM